MRFDINIWRRRKDNILECLKTTVFRNLKIVFFFGLGILGLVLAGIIFYWLSRFIAWIGDLIQILGIKLQEVLESVGLNRSMIIIVTVVICAIVFGITQFIYEERERASKKQLKNKSQNLPKPKRVYRQQNTRRDHSDEYYYDEQ